MDNDDQPIGRVLSRREVLGLFGAAGAAILVGCGPSATTGAQSSAAAVASPSLNAEAATAVATAATDGSASGAATTETVAGCVVTPELTEGPYFVDEQLNRSDIRSDSATGEVKAGAPLLLTMRVSQIDANGCTPLQSALVDVWHCDAEGVYSGVTDRSFDTTDQDFLRGQQQTDANGVATFTSIYPGWYPGRAVHIHFKVRTDAGSNQTYEFTSQMFFDDALSDQVFTQQPYAAKGQRNTLNRNDGIYGGSGEQLVLALTPADQGYSGTFDIALDLSDTVAGAADGGGGPPRR
jgi:protocatechuate 3,4-dioxygenase beta subunit